MERHREFTRMLRVTKYWKNLYFLSDYLFLPPFNDPNYPISESILVIKQPE